MPYFRRVAIGAIVTLTTVWNNDPSRADVIVQEPGANYILFEAEDYELLEGVDFEDFLEVGKNELVTDFGTAVLPDDANVSGTALFDQHPDGGNLSGTAIYDLQFNTPGTYHFYLHYTMFENLRQPESYSNEDSVFLPMTFGERPGAEGWATFPKMPLDTDTEHNDPNEDPPFWEGNFHWGTIRETGWPVDGTGNFVRRPFDFQISDADVGAVIEFAIATREDGATVDAMVLSTDPDLTANDLNTVLFGDLTQGPDLLAGDADQDFDFDQLDIVKVSVANKYLSGKSATWGEGDWDGAPGGTAGNPPPGDGFFNQLDVISALAPGHYLAGPYAALSPTPGAEVDEQTSLVYDPSTGELAVNAPASRDLTSIFITSSGNKFLGDKPAVLDGPFDSFAPDNIFKSTIGGSFGDISFGTVLPAELSAAELIDDLTASGSLAGGGGLGEVDLIYVPEPTSIVLIAIAFCLISPFFRQKNTCKAVLGRVT